MTTKRDNNHDDDKNELPIVYYFKNQLKYSIHGHSVFV
jgi:hypothetical protein